MPEEKTATTVIFPILSGMSSTSSQDVSSYSIAPVSSTTRQAILTRCLWRTGAAAIAASGLPKYWRKVHDD